MFKSKLSKFFQLCVKTDQEMEFKMEFKMKFSWLLMEVKLEIFSCLSVRDNLKIRSVCKQSLLNIGMIWSTIKFKRLCCYQRKLAKWKKFYSDYNHNYDCWFVFIRSFLERVSDYSKLSRVKYLHANLYPDCEELNDAFDLLNSFKTLYRFSYRFEIILSQIMDGKQFPSAFWYDPNGETIKFIIQNGISPAPTID